MGEKETESGRIWQCKMLLDQRLDSRAFRLEPKSMEVAPEWRREGHLNYLWKDAETFMRNDMFVSLYELVGSITLADS